MKMVIVPDSVSEAINLALDKAFAECPDAPQDDREAHYQQLLEFFDVNGYVPDFKLEKRHP